MILLGSLFALGLFDLVYSFTGAYAIFGILYPAAHALLNIILFLALSFIWSKKNGRHGCFWGSWWHRWGLILLWEHLRFSS